MARTAAAPASCRGRLCALPCARPRYLGPHGGPDFDSIAAAGIDFVYLKASEGLTLNDPAFLRNYLAARRAGLKVGAYHFFRFDCDGMGQAANFLTSTEKCDLQLPMAIDIEEWGNPAGVATEIINERIATMVAVVGSQRGPTIIYTIKNATRTAAPTVATLSCGYVRLPTRR